MVTMIFALILKEPANGDDEIAKEIVKDTSFPPEILLAMLNQRRKHLIPRPPPHHLLTNERLKGKRVQKTQRFLRDTMFYTLFLGLAFFTVYSMQDVTAYSQAFYMKHIFTNWKVKLNDVHHLYYLFLYN